MAGLLVVTLSLPPVAFANPQGGQVRQGQVRIDASPGHLRIHQQSQRAVIDWESFSIDRGEVTRFLQPNASAAALNLVRGASASKIEGMLRANGNVYLINPNGILIGPGGTIDVGGFVASTLDTSDDDFMRGGDLRFSGNSDAAIINLGSISALDGDVVLMAGSVLNAGTIRAPRGTAALAAGNDILLAESGEERVFVRGSGGSRQAEGVTNTGEIEANIAELKAHGGNIYGMAVKNEGRVAATGVTRSGGQIFLSAGGGKVRSTGSLKAKRSDGSGGRVRVDSGTTGKTEIGGTVDASGENGAGGEIAILGNEIEVFDGTLILNDGETGGGRTYLGGGRHGADASLANATNLSIGSGSLISANARGTGNGGEIVLFATDTTTVHGLVSAQGGTFGGDGGFIELSGQGRLYVPDLVGQVRLSAPLGASGTLLLDPANINVIHGTGGGIMGTTMTDGALMDVLANFPVLIWTSDYGAGGEGDITFAADVNLTWSSAHSLAFQADRDMIFLAGARIFASGSGAFNATAARSISMGSGASVRTTNGSLTLAANQQVIPTTGTFSGITVSGGTVRSDGTGNVTLLGKGGNTGTSHGILVQNGGTVSGGASGILTMTGRGVSSGGGNGLSVSGPGSMISSDGSNILLDGKGSTTGGRGLFLGNGASISASGSGDLSIIAVAGTTGGFNEGIFMNSSGGSPVSISTASGDLTISAQGGGDSTNLNNQGLRFSGDGNSISSGGSLTISATGGGSGAGNISNRGIELTGAGSSISAAGSLRITGTGGAGATVSGIFLGNSTAIVTTGNSDLTLTADGIGISSSATINSGTGTTTIRPLTNGFAVNLGGADVDGTTLGLTDTELDRITAGTVQIGNASSGAITVSNAITHGNRLSLTTGAGVIINEAISMAANKNLTIDAFGTSTGEISLANANAALSASGTGSITLGAGRNLVLSPGSSITAVDGALSLTANRGPYPAYGSLIGMDLDGATVATTGTGAITLSGHGGDATGDQVGIRLRGGTSLATHGGDLTLLGEASAPLSSGIRIDLASLTSGGGVLELRGAGANTSIDSPDTNASIGAPGDTVIVKSVSGAVGIFSRVRGYRLQLQDLGGADAMDFTLNNSNNDIVQFNTSGNGPNGRIGTLVFREANGFRVTDFLGGSGITATGFLDMRVPRFSGSSIVIDAPVTSQGGNITIVGRDVVVDGTEISTIGGGGLELNAGRAMLVLGDSLLSVTDGDLALSANRDEVSMPGNFTGITILGSRLESLGTGAITLRGTGGNGGSGPDFGYSGFTNPASNGIRLDGGAVIASLDTTSSNFGIEISGSGGGSNSDSVGVVIANTDTTLSTAGRTLLVEGFGGGQSGGQRNRGILFTGGLLQTGGSGNLTLYGAGGSGVNENDGVQMNGGARFLAVNGEITLDGYAGDTLGIGVMLGNTAGNLSISGTGGITVRGSGSNADGIFLGNDSATIGGTNASFVDLTSSGQLRLMREVRAAGGIFLEASDGAAVVGGSILSQNGNIVIDGDDVTINAPVTANGGDIEIIFGDHPYIGDSVPGPGDEASSLPFDGTAAINALLTADGSVFYTGGDGSRDLLTFAGYPVSGIDLDHASLDGVESVVGSGSGHDRVRGPAAASTFQMTGANAFQVGGVSFTAFENILGGAADDTLAFSGNATLSGTLDGGGGTNTLDYTTYGTSVIIDLENGAATGIIGGFENIATFTGSGNIDTITGPGSASTYTFTGPDAMQVGSVAVSGFENVIAGPLEDEFIFLPGSGIRGSLDGGSSPNPVVNRLNYAGYGAPVTVNLGAAPLASGTGIAGGFSNVNQFTGSALATDQFFGPAAGTLFQLTAPNTFSSPTFSASGFENLTGGIGSDTFAFSPGAALGGRLSGGASPGTDTLDYSAFGRAVTINVGPDSATGIGGGFTDLERILGSAANDRFHFLNQATIAFVDGGGGTDLLEINDSTLRGDHTYEISDDSVSRNPIHTFRGFESLRLFLGTGNNTVNSDFFSFTQFIHGGSGYNTLNLPGIASLNQGNPIRNVHHYGIVAPRPEGTDTGGLLQTQVGQPAANPNTDQGSDDPNRFSIVDPGTLSQQIGALSGAFAAAITAQASLIVVDGNPYLVFRPFSLDGSGLTPSNLAIATLNESLGVDANLELASAIGYTGPILLFNPDGPVGLDLSGDPIDPAILTILQESLTIAAAAELSEALGLNLVVSLLPGDGTVPTAMDGSAPGPGVLLLLSDQLGDPAANELNAALGTN